MPAHSIVVVLSYLRPMGQKLALTLGLDEGACAIGNTVQRVALAHGYLEHGGFFVSSGST
jgi:hypothetical protein